MPKNPHGQGHDTRYVRLQKNYCFACGRNNADGMRLKFVYDQKQDCFVCRFRLGKKFTGPPGHCHGGIIATILDEAMGKVNKLRQVVALTTQITVDYLKPVPLNQPLRVESHEVRVRGRRHVNSADSESERPGPGPQPRYFLGHRSQTDVCEVCRAGLKHVFSYVEPWYRPANIRIRDQFAISHDRPSLSVRSSLPPADPAPDPPASSAFPRSPRRLYGNLAGRHPSQW